MASRSAVAAPITDVAVLRRMRIARDTMDRDWAQAIDVDTVAAAAGYSRYHFVRLFGRTYGESPGRYLSRRRVERAAELLRSANLTVTEICLLVGFTSLGSFSSRFKEHTGMSPTRFRARAAADGPAPVPGCFVLFWAGAFRADRARTARSEKPADVSPS